MEILKSIALRYQSKLEARKNEPFGTCYAAGPCLSNYLNSIGIEARAVTGTLVLRDKHGKQIIYGRSQFSKKNIGMYHTWCEAIVDGTTYIVDPSLKYNKVYLKKHHPLKIKISHHIPDVLVTQEKETYWWKFKEDEKLKPLSISYLEDCSSELLTYLSQLG